MIRIVGAAIALTLMGVSSVQAQTIDLRTFKCSEFVALPAQTQDWVALWLDGFLADDQAPDGLKIDFSGTDADFITEKCKKSPDTPLLQAVEQADADTAK